MVAMEHNGKSIAVSGGLLLQKLNYARKFI